METIILMLGYISFTEQSIECCFCCPSKNIDFGSMNTESSDKSISEIELIPLSAVGLMILVASFLPRCSIEVFNM